MGKYGKSIAAKTKFNDSPDVQKFIQQSTGNESAYVKNFLPAVEKLMKVDGNPTSIQSIGAGNYSSTLSQISSFYGGGAGKNTQQKDDAQLEFNCELLLQTANNELTEEQLKKKEICEELQHLKAEEERTGIANNEFEDPPTGQNGVSEFNDPESGLTTTLNLIANTATNPVAPSYTVSTVPDANTPGQMIYVSDETGGAVIAFSNGSAWLRCTDRAVVS